MKLKAAQSTHMGTARDLAITYWLREPGDSPLTVAVPGLRFAGWWPDLPPDVDMLADLATLWPKEAASLVVELDILEDPDGRRHQAYACLRIHRYPAREWTDLVRSSLKYFVDRGAAISWAGGWECFLQYSPAETFAGCYAAYTAATGLIIGSTDLDEPLTYLDQVPTVSERLHEAVAELRRSRLAIEGEWNTNCR